MKAKYFIVNYDAHIGTIYESEKFGRVVVFKTNEINLEKEIIIHSIEANEVMKKDMLDLVMSILPK